MFLAGTAANRKITPQSHDLHQLLVAILFIQLEDEVTLNLMTYRNNLRKRRVSMLPERIKIVVCRDLGTQRVAVEIIKDLETKDCLWGSDSWWEKL